MRLIRTFLLLPLRLLFGCLRLVLVILNVLLRLLAGLGNFVLGIILVVLAFMFIGYFVFVTPGQLGADTQHILFSIVVFFVASTVLALIPSLLDGIINFCNRVLQL